VQNDIKLDIRPARLQKEIEKMFEVLPGTETVGQMVGNACAALSPFAKTFLIVANEAHLETLTCMMNLMMSYVDQGRWNEAVNMQMKIMDPITAVLREEHPDSLMIMANLGVFYRELGRFSKATELCEKVFKLRSKVFGNNHPGTLLCLSHLSSATREITRVLRGSLASYDVGGWTRTSSELDYHI